MRRILGGQHVLPAIYRRSGSTRMYAGRAEAARGTAGDTSGSAGDTSGSAGDTSGSADVPVHAYRHAYGTAPPGLLL